MFDFSKLEGRIVEKYGTRCAFAEVLGMAPARLSDRLACKVSFRIVEMQDICELLDIPNDQVAAYFFTKKVR